MLTNAGNHNSMRMEDHASNPQATRKLSKTGSNSMTLPEFAVIGSVIKLGRLKLGWSQEVLAGKSNYDVKTIQNVENKQTKNPQTIRALCDLLEKELLTKELPKLEQLWNDYKKVASQDDYSSHEAQTQKQAATAR